MICGVFFFRLIAKCLLQSATVNMYANTVAHKFFKNISHDITDRKFTYSNTLYIIVHTNTEMTLPEAGYIYKHHIYIKSIPVFA